MALTRKVRRKIRSRGVYRKWLFAIRKRDNMTCQFCGDPGTEVHHLKSYSGLLIKYKIRTAQDAIKCKELWDINLGVLCCTKCHDEVHANGPRNKEKKPKDKHALSNKKIKAKLEGWLGNLLGKHEALCTEEDKQQPWFEIHRARRRRQKIAKKKYDLRKWLSQIQVQHKLQSFKMKG